MNQSTIPNSYLEISSFTCWKGLVTASLMIFSTLGYFSYANHF